MCWWIDSENQLPSLIGTLEELPNRFAPKSIRWRFAEYLHPQMVQLDASLNVLLAMRRMQWLKYYSACTTKTPLQEEC